MTQSSALALSAHTASGRPRLLLAVLLTVAGGYSLLQSLVVPALPTLQRELHTSATGIAWLFTAFLLATCIATPLAGRYGDLLGKKRMLVVMLVGLAGGTLLCAVATTLSVMIVGRVLQGLGGAVFPLAFGVIRDEFPRNRIPFGIASMTAVLGMGGVLGIVLAGPILDKLSYHWLFWIPLIVILASLAATVLVIPESAVRAPGRMSWPSALFFSGWLVCLLFAVSKAPEWGWTSKQVFGLVAVAALLGIAWLYAERRAVHPFVDLKVLAHQGIWTSNLSAFLLGCGMYSGFVLIPQFAQAPPSSGYGFGLSVTTSGLILLPWSAAMLVSGALSSRISAARGPRRPLAIGAAIGASGFVFLLAENNTEWELLIATALIGTGVGLAFSSVANLVVESVPSTQTSVASGVNIIARTLGGVIGTQVAFSVVASTVNGSGPPSRTGYLWVFGLSAGALALALLTTVLAPRTRVPSASRPDEASEFAPGGDRQLLGGERVIVPDRP